MGKLEEYMKGRTEGIEELEKRNQISESHRYFPERHSPGIKCGHSIKLEKLVDANAYCECSRHSWYKTNSKEQMLEINCIGCGALVAMSWNEKKEDIPDNRINKI